MKPYLLKLSGVTALAALSGWIIFQLFFPDHYPRILPLILLMFFAFTLISHTLQVRAAGKSFAQFTKVNMIITISRLFLYTGVIILYLVLNKQNIVSFVATFASLYIIYTILEIREIARILRPAANRDT